jgi:RNA polymerase sigma factor (TIGR02999 family)
MDTPGGGMEGTGHERDPPTAELFAGARAGDVAAIDRLFSLAYDELRAVARQARRHGAGETLDTTALLHESYFRLSAGHPIPAMDRAHFLAIAARAMRQVLVDEARRRLAAKRGGGAFLRTLDDHGDEVGMPAEDYLTLERAMAALEAMEPRRARVVECRFIGGMTVEETAAALGVSEPTVKRDWRVARAWLADALQA